MDYGKINKLPEYKPVAMKKVLFFSFMLTLHTLLYTQEPTALPEKPGTWSYAYLDDENTKMYCREFGMTPDEIALFRKKLDHIVTVLHQNPVMNNPRGVDPVVDSRPLYPHGYKNHPENYGYIGEINFRLCMWFNSKGKDYRQTIEPPRVSIYLNNIVPLRTSAFNVGGPEGEDIKKAESLVLDICKPMKIKELAPGITLYDAALVVNKQGRSLYLPCSVSEAYKRLIAFYELAVKKEPVFQFMLDGIKKEYSTLTPAQLSSPAYFGGMFSGITPEKNGDPLYLFNRDYFDRNLPKTAVQLIVFPIDADYFRKESDFVSNSFGFLRINQFQHTLDMNALVQLID
jgi:hypothetical protein